MLQVPRVAIIAIAISLTAILVGLAIDRWLWMNQFADGLPMSPEAKILRGSDGSAIENRKLKELVEQSFQNADSTSERMGNILSTLYRVEEFHHEIVAVTVKNNSTSEITVHQLVISGYKPCYILQDCQTQALNRPVIFEEVAEGVLTPILPTIAQSEILKPGDLFTAYVEGDFRLDYASGLCYSYDISDPSTHACVHVSQIN